MVSASAIDDRCFVESSNSGLLQPCELCVAPPSPKLCVTPPTPNIVSPTSPPLSNNLSKESLSPAVVGSGFHVAKLKPKKKPRHPVLVLPRYLAAGSKVDHSLMHHVIPRPEYGRHFSQPAVDLHRIATSCKKIGQSTQSLTSTLEEASFRNLLQQEDMRGEAQCGSKISRGLRAIRLFPQNKLSKRLIALKARLQSNSSMDEEETEFSNVDVGTDRVQNSCAKKAKVKFERRHSRSSSDSMAAAIVRSLMENNMTGLDRVVEVKESPGSSPTSPSRRESYASIELSKHDSEHSGKRSEFDSSPVDASSDVHITISESFLRLPLNDNGPELRYVDGHLISNTSSNVSSTSDSSSSEEDASEDYSLDVPIKDNSLSDCSTPSPAVPSQLNVISTVTGLHVDCDNADECHSPLVDCSSTDIKPTGNVPVFELTTFDSPHAVSTQGCTTDIEQVSNVYYFGESSTNANLCQQRSENTNSSSAVKNVDLSTKLCQFRDIQPSSVQNIQSASVQENDVDIVPSFVNKPAENTKTINEQSYNFSVPVSDNEKMRVPLSTVDDISVQISKSNFNCTSLMHTEDAKHTKECNNNNNPSCIPESDFSTTIMQESVCTLEINSMTNPPSLPQIENTSTATPDPGTTPNVLSNQENVIYISSPVEEGSSNGLSADNSIHVNPFVKTDSDTSACNLDVVLDVGGSCKTNSLISMQNSPVGKVSVISMLNIPISPLHKSQSATTLCSCPTAIVEHDTNDEQASPCCGGNLQFHNIKHGPCFVPPSRQQHLFSGGEEDKQLAGSPQQAVPMSAGGSKISPSPAKLSTLPGIHRRSSDSDLSITPKGNVYFIIWQNKYCLYSSPNIIRVIKLRLSWAGQIAYKRKGEIHAKF